MTTIDVTGTGTAEADPDFASLSFHANAVEATSRAALASAKRITAAIIQLLDDGGVAERDRGAQHSNLHRRTRWHNEVETFLGWEAQITVTCTVREPEQAYGLVESVTEATDVNINGPHWIVDEANPAHDVAREGAVASARRKAQSYATAAGLTLGRLTVLAEGAGRVQGGPRMARRMTSMEMEDAVDPASQTVSASVTLSFEAEPAGS